MNWIKKVLHISDKIKRVLKKRPTKEEIANSDWTSCCTGPVLKKDLEASKSFFKTGPVQQEVQSLLAISSLVGLFFNTLFILSLM